MLATYLNVYYTDVLKLTTVWGGAFLVVCIYAYFLLFTAGSCIKNVSMVYFCNDMLGTDNDGFTQTMLSVIGVIPMGIVIMPYVPWKQYGDTEMLRRFLPGCAGMHASCSAAAEDGTLPRSARG